MIHNELDGEFQEQQCCCFRPCGRNVPYLQDRYLVCHSHYI